MTTSITLSFSWRKEFLIFLICFLLANAVNVYAIIDYNAKWCELWSVAGYVLALSCVFYIIALIFRILVFGIARLFKKNDSIENKQ